MAMQMRTLVIIAVMASVALFVIGIVIGHFAIEKDSGGGTEAKVQRLQVACPGTVYTADRKTYKDGYLDSCVKASCYEANVDCNEVDLPRTYNAYHLGDKAIVMDGILDDEAWLEVPWTESFVDIRGADYPKPRFDTKVKVRWDDERMYVAARMEETDFWGTFTEDESLVWQENAFEVYAVPDGSMHNYKELEISVKNVTWDLGLETTYLDRPQCTEEEHVRVRNWTSDQVKKTSFDGTYNDPQAPKGTHWTVEWSFTFAALAQYTDRRPSQATPTAGEAWFMIFARPEYEFKIENNRYVKDTTAETGWWVWQPTYAVALHIPNKFGLVQFKRDLQDTRFYYDKWHIYQALFDVFDAEHKFKALNGMFIDELQKLDVPPRTLSEKCVDVSLSLNQTDFIATVKSRVSASMATGHIRGDRYVWFT